MGSRKSKQRSGYLPGLDGLRALAVLLVVAYHLWPQFVAGGYIGVDIFFVISGFLITSLLIREHAEKGSINLKQFWLRRARRLLPALLVVIGLSSTAALMIGGDVLVGIGRQIIGALTFSNNWVEIQAGTNYFSLGSPHLFTNFWSLAVEEQFYAFWPLIILTVLVVPSLIRRYKIGLTLSVMLSLGSAVLMAVLVNPTDPTRAYYGTDTHAFGLMIGAGLAFWGNARYQSALGRGVKNPSAGFRHVAALKVAAGASLGLLFIASVFLSQSLSLTYSGGLYAVSLLTAVVILCAVSTNGLLRKVLEYQPLRFIGERSYGIYLWHWPIFILLHYWIGPALNQTFAALATIILTVSCAIVSYRYIEKPIRRTGFKRLIQNTFKKEVAVLNTGITAWKLRPHPLLLVVLILLATTTIAVISAPKTTKAEQRIAAGEALIAAQQKAKAQMAAHKKHQPITGSDITLVGDSVSLASTPELQSAFPGIYIDAQISRSMRRGGLETIEQLLQAKTLRSVLVVALGTNGYYGDGYIDRLMQEVGKDRQVIFVTSHAPVEWSEPNNQALRAVQPKYTNLYIADWDAAINAHPDYLGPDGIHPGPTGGTLYVECIKNAIDQVNQHL
jgi:peptidoglycan/LPS O-acetylase OafA/YrhL